MSLRTHRSGGLPSNPRSRSAAPPAPAAASDDYYGRDYGSGYSNNNQQSSRPAPTPRAQQGLPGSVRDAGRRRNDDGYGSGGGRSSADYGYARSEGGRDDDRYGRHDDTRYARSDYGGDDRYADPTPAGRGASNRYAQQQQDAYGRPNSIPSSTSTSSSSSSLLDRMKQRSNAPSARTSVDDDAPPTAKPSLRSTGRSRLQQSQQREPSPEYEPDDGPVPSGEGSSLWGRMVSAAGNLKVNVSSAISNVTREDGEETPPGGESRLTRAMKEYYLRKARDPNDLPAWLFDPADRQLHPKASTVSSSTTTSASSRSRRQEEPPPPASRGLKDIYERAAASSSNNSSQSSLGRAATTRYGAGGEGGDSRAASRLKAMREAKRTALGVTKDYDNYYRADQGQQQQYEPEPEPEPAPTRRPTRVGLPSRPGAGRM